MSHSDAFGGRRLHDHDRIAAALEAQRREQYRLLAEARASDRPQRLPAVDGIKPDDPIHETESSNEFFDRITMNGACGD